MQEALESFDQTLPTNSWVHIVERKGKTRIHLSPLPAQSEPISLTRIKLELVRRWPMTSLLDILKEADLSIGFSDCFKSAASRENLEHTQLQRRLLLCLFGLGTNTGLKRIIAGDHGVSIDELRYAQRRYINKEALRAAIAQVGEDVNPTSRAVQAGYLRSEVRTQVPPQRCNAVKTKALVHR
ncbi:MAG: Tn3 family transposase [Anaerolineae bacterium]|nr:Tn3 family transposase [Gloeobacterales cyanobacterium ES-bin-313]